MIISENNYLYARFQWSMISLFGMQIRVKPFSRPRKYSPVDKDLGRRRGKKRHSLKSARNSSNVHRCGMNLSNKVKKGCDENVISLFCLQIVRDQELRQKNEKNQALQVLVSGGNYSKDSFLCMKAPYYEGRRRTQWFLRKNPVHS